MSKRERRIVVALDLTPASLAALEAGAELAARLNLRLLGLFVEDEALQRLAELPITRVLRQGVGGPAPFEPADVARAERVLRAQARSALEARARRAQLRWEFEVVRGAVDAALRKATGPGDLLAIGRGGRSATLGPGSVTKAVMTAGPRVVIVAGEGCRLVAPVVALDDGGPAGQAVLAVAAELARALAGELLVLVGDTVPVTSGANGNESEDGELATWVRSRLPTLPAEGPDAAPSPALRVRRLPAGADGASAAAQALASGCGTLVVPGRGAWRPRKLLWTTLARAGCPVVVVRTGE